MSCHHLSSSANGSDSSKTPSSSSPEGNKVDSANPSSFTSTSKSSNLSAEPQGKAVIKEVQGADKLSEQTATERAVDEIVVKGTENA